MDTGAKERLNNGAPWWAIVIIILLLLFAVWWLQSNQQSGDEGLARAINGVSTKFDPLKKKVGDLDVQVRKLKTEAQEKFDGVNRKLAALKKAKSVVAPHRHDTTASKDIPVNPKVDKIPKPEPNVVYVDNAQMIDKIAAACAPLPIVSDGNGGFRCNQRNQSQNPVVPAQQLSVSDNKNCYRNDRGELMCKLSNNWKWYTAIGCGVGYAITKTGIGCAYVGVGAGLGSAVGEKVGGETGSHVGGVLGGVTGGLLLPHEAAALSVVAPVVGGSVGGAP